MKVMTLEDYIKRDKHITTYLKQMVDKLQDAKHKYPQTFHATQDAKRRAYKDILYKMTGEFRKHRSDG